MLTGIKSAEFFVDQVPLHAELITTATIMYSLDDYEAIEATVMLGRAVPLQSAAADIRGAGIKTGFRSQNPESRNSEEKNSNCRAGSWPAWVRSS